MMFKQIAARRVSAGTDKIWQSSKRHLRGAAIAGACALVMLTAACSGSLGGSGSSVVAVGTEGPSTTIQLGWQPNLDAVAGYMVYYGPEADNTPNLASELPVDAAEFNAFAPAVSFSSATLGLQPGTNVCFRLRAYNSGGGVSAWSEAACGIV